MLKTSMAGPWEEISEIRERPPPMLKTSMMGPLRGDVGGLGAPTTYVEDVDGEAPRRQPPSVVLICGMTFIGSIGRSNSTHGSQSPCT
jgi:hypothetical protein